MRCRRILLPILVLALSGSAVIGAVGPAHRKLSAVPFSDVKLEDAFWSPRLQTNRERSLPHNFKWCEQTGRISNFVKAAGRMPGKFEGIYFNDSDVYKVLEGAAYSLADRPDPALAKIAADVIAKIAAAQREDGYLNCYYTLAEPGKRWTNLPVTHELYCSGHLMEAAVAHWRATGKRTFLDVAIKLADHIDRTFGPGKKLGVPGHEEVELALVKLYQATGEERYFKLAKFFIDLRGDASRRKLTGEYAQDHEPIRKQSRIVGHAVRAMYLYCGVADVAAYTGDRELIAAMQRLWQDVVGTKMYLTGGIGVQHRGEGFGNPYELYNDMAYCETCAAIGLALWAHRLNLLDGDARYADVLERAIYNGILSGIALDGEHFFYVNPLTSYGGHHREPFFGCACCPTNVARFVPSIPGYVYATGEDGIVTVHGDCPDFRGEARDNGTVPFGRKGTGTCFRPEGRKMSQSPAACERLHGIFVNLYAAGKGKVPLGGSTVTLTQETRYPWEGRVRLRIEPQQPGEFTIHLRVPDWCPRATLAVNGRPLGQLALQQGYALLRRTWKPGDVVDLDLAMEVRRIEAHPRVEADRGRVALQRGPIVYCFEGVDNGGNVKDIMLPREPQFTVEYRKNLLGGMALIKTVSQDGRPLVAVPYYAWDHRQPGPMAVWVYQYGKSPQPALDDPSWQGKLYRPLDPATLGSCTPRGFNDLIKATASHCRPEDALEALNDGREPHDSGDHAIPRFTWWDHRGTKEWVQYDFPAARKVSATEVYWFDDLRQHGSCRLPQSWRLLYKDGHQWKPVAGASAYNTALDKFNRAEFPPVETNGLRIEVQLKPGFSGGILEWKWK
jgi:uncharacterized protein